MSRNIKTSAKKITSILSKGLTILALAFIIYKISKMKIDLSLLSNGPLVISILFIGSFVSVINVLLRAVAWNNNLSFLADQPTNKKKVFQIYTKANLGKYLPGNIMHFVERNLYAAEIGMGQLETAASTLFEIVGQCTAALVIGAALSFSYIVRFVRQYMVGWYLLCVIILFIVCAVGIIVAVKKSEKLRFLISKMKNRDFLLMFSKNLLYYVLDLLLLGVMLVVSVCALSGEIPDLSQVMLLISENTIAWLIGFVVPGAPGGVGIREAIIQIMSEGTRFADVILIAAIIQRIISILGDVLAYLIFNVFGRNRGVKVE